MKDFYLKSRKNKIIILKQLWLQRSALTKMTYYKINFFVKPKIRHNSTYLDISSANQRQREKTRKRIGIYSSKNTISITDLIQKLLLFWCIGMFFFAGKLFFTK